MTRRSLFNSESKPQVNQKNLQFKFIKDNLRTTVKRKSDYLFFIETLQYFKYHQKKKQQKLSQLISH